MTQNNEGNAGTLAAGQNIRERDYWLEKLSGQLTKIFFPYDYRKTDEEEKARLTFKISGDAYALLMKISNKSNPRLHILLVTGWLILLNKYTAGSDIVIGVPTYKQDVQGELINTVLALRANVTADMSVKEMLMQVGKLVVEADKNQNYPMETLAYKLDLTDSGEGFPLFDLSVLLETIHDKSYLDRIRQNMIVSFRLGENYLEGEIEYNPQLYRESTVQRIAGHYNQLLENVLSDVNRSVAEVDMVSPEEQRRVREEFNDNAADFHREKSIYTLIEEHAEKTPENMALSFEGQDISYKQLNSAANYVAAQLIKNGVKADDTVGVLMGRSPFMVTAILAVWKAGGAYIPLDVKYPAQRLTGILADSETSVLLAGPGVDIPQLKQVYDGTVIDVIPSLEAAREGKNHPNPNVDVSMNGLAYVIYTSGSTGKPKGAMVEHIGMMNHIQSKINLLGVTGKSIVAQNASHTFDISVWQFFVALAEGGKTVIYPDLLVLDALKFIDRVIADKLTILEVVPSYLNVVLDAVGSRCEAPAEAANKVPLPIDYLLVTGEEVKPHLVNRWFEMYPQIKMVNAYGPTEASDDITHFVMDGPPGVERVPIGKTVQNLDIYVVNHHKQLCPVGVNGEIWVSGVGVGRGYLKDPDRTAQVFMDDPFASEPGIRLYRTGDLGRWLPDGSVDFLGRLDYQVKIRGFRIELGEIESRLQEHQQLKEAVVIDREDKDDKKYLCAYIVAEETLPDTDVLKNFLLQSLPDYMVPAYFVELKAIPLTPNGKIDRKALPEPDTRGSSGLPFISAALLDRLAAEIGGTKASAAKKDQTTVAVDAAADIRDAFDKLNSLSRDCPDKRKYYPLSHAQKMFYYNEKMYAGSAFNQVCFSVKYKEILDFDLLKEAFNKILIKNPGLRLRFAEPEIDGSILPAQYVVPYAPYVPDFTDFTGEGILQGDTPEERLKQWEWEQVEQTVPLIDSQLYYLSYLKFRTEEPGESGETGETGYFLKIHHLATDGWSFSKILDNIHQYYRSLQAGETVDETPAPSFVEFISDEKQYLESEQFKKDREFLHKTMLPLPAEVDLSTSRAGSFDIDNDVVSIRMPGKVYDKMAAYGKENRASMFRMMMAGLCAYVHRVTGLEDITLSSVKHSRYTEEIKQMSGMLLDFFPIRATVHANEGFGELLKTSGDRLRTLLKNHGRYPYDILLTELKDISGKDPGYLNNINIVDHSPREDDFEARHLSNHYALTPISLHINREGAPGRETGVRLEWEYQSARFKPEDIEGIHRGLVTLLSNALDFPGKPLSQLDLLSQEDKELILHTFNDTAAEISPGKTLHQIFQQQAERTPENIAVRVENHPLSLTYRELDQRADALARVLRQKGVGTNRVVGIIAKRSLELMVGKMAVLKAGGANMPIGLSYPDNRIRRMCDDAGVDVILSDAGRDLMHMDYQIIDMTDENLYTGDVSNPGPGRDSACPDDRTAAAVYYTSGSTGTPKGVMVEHKGIINFLANLLDMFPMQENDVILQRIPLIFDGSLEELYRWFFSGASIYFLDPAKSDGPGELVEAVAKGNVTFAFVPPALQLEFCHYIEKNRKQKDVAALKLVLSAGEALLPAHVDAFNRVLFKANGTRLCNLYGPTETSIGVTGFTCPTHDNVDKIPIGKPFKNVRVYILDDNYRLVPVGVPGQLCISGKQMTRGYINRPNLNREAFVDNPYEPGEKMYLSGDLVKWLPDGNIDFLGRIDAQVQVGGIRVEPGEIETLLLQHEDIEEAVVVQWENDGQQVLCAYLESEADLAKSGFKDILLKELPHFMIPSKFIQLDRMPITAGGKINRKELTALVHAGENGKKYTLEQLIDNKEIAGEKRSLSASALEKEIGWGVDDMDEKTVLTDEEKQEILVTFNNTDADYPADKSIHDLFRDQAKKTPDLPALVGRTSTDHEKECRLTYKELDEKSDQLARKLFQKGLTPDGIVGLMTERTVEMIVGMMAVLKAGGAYLAIALTYPDKRLEFMCRDSCMETLLTDNTRPLPGSLTHLGMDITAEENYLDDTNPPAESNPDSLATVFYTSGSTGNPKGVLVEHRGLVNRIHWMQSRYPIDEKDVILQKTSVVFDVSVWELFWWSFYGASVYLVPPGKGGHPQDAVDAIKNGKVTTMHFTPTAMIPFLHHVEAEKCVEDVSTLRQVFASGEALPPALVNHFNRLLNKTNGTGLYNLYGPTEASVDVTYYDCPTDKELDKVPIGKPIDNIRMYIVDRKLNLPAKGVAGQLCIAGIGLARGYMNRPNLTRDTFVDNPHEPGERFYLTGDLARWMPDGNIEFLGRIDHQVQINGIRIELGEIESVLLKHPDIKEAVVVTRLDEHDEPFLCAYLVAANDLAGSDFKESLARDLPHYMLPARYIELEKLPTTTTGKVNRKVLKAIDLQLESSVEFVAPATEKESQIAEIWKEVLNLEQVGVNDNFFDIGGNSLGIIQVNVRLKEVFRQEIPALIMFEYPTIASMIAYLEKTTGDAAEEPEEKDRTEVKSKGRNRMQQRKDKIKRRRG